MNELTKFEKEIEINFNDKKTLLILPKIEKNNLVLSSRNLPHIQLTDAASLNAYVVLNSEKIIFINQALKVFEDHFLKNNAS